MYTKTITDSGLRIVTEQMPEAQSVNIGAWICTGSSHEPEERTGISHFLEHMLFKGTATRTAADIAETIDSLGGCLDAFTDREFVCYYARVLPEHTSIALEMLGDMLSRPRLDASDIAIEQRVVLEEIMACEDSPEEFLMDRFTGVIWEGSSLSRNILGTCDSIRQLDPPALKDHWSRTYVPPAVLISAAGRLKHEEIVQWVERHMADLPDRALAGEPSPRFDELGPPEVCCHHQLLDKDCERIYLCAGTRSFGQTCPDRFASHLLDSVISGGCSFRLFQEIREKRGLVYSIGSSSACYRVAGFLAVSASCGAESAQEVADLIGRELRLVKVNGITRDELERAKQQARGGLLLATESPGERMVRNAQNEVYFDRMVPLAEVLDAVERVSLDDVHRVAHEILDNRLLNLVGVGPFGDGDLNLEMSVG